MSQSVVFCSWLQLYCSKQRVRLAVPGCTQHLNQRKLRVVSSLRCDPPAVGVDADLENAGDAAQEQLQ